MRTPHGGPGFGRDEILQFLNSAAFGLVQAPDLIQHDLVIHRPVQGPQQKGLLFACFSHPPSLEWLFPRWPRTSFYVDCRLYRPTPEEAPVVLGEEWRCQHLLASAKLRETVLCKYSAFMHDSVICDGSASHAKDLEGRVCASLALCLGSPFLIPSICWVSSSSGLGLGSLPCFRMSRISFVRNRCF